MKKSFKLILLFTIVAAISSCVKMMENAQDVPIIGEIEVAFKVNATTAFQYKDQEVVSDPNFPTEGLTVNFVNLQNNAVTSAKADADGVAVAKVTPGDYSVIVSGKVEYDGYTYMMNATQPSVSLVKTITKEEAMASKDQISIRPAKLGNLIFSEIYINGSSQAYYFRDQTYHIYNNGNEVEYLDGVCVAQMHPNLASASATLPIWPDEDGVNNFVYALVVWQFPGDGDDYPLQPGEAVVLAQEARNHYDNMTDASYVTIDNSMANWECWAGNQGRNNPDVANMPPLFTGGINWGYQWLTTVFGPALCIFRPDDGTVITENFYDEKDSEGKFKNCQHEVNKTKQYARIPASWVLDGVESMEDHSLLGKKRIPGFVDAGAAAVGASYRANVIVRKVVSKRADGTPIFADTNNSTEDFELINGPVIRRYGQKAPAWDGTNNN